MLRFFKRRNSRGHTPESAQRDRARRANEDIDNHLAREQKETGRFIRILLLGAGDAGKTTMIKQMKKIHGRLTQQDLISSQQFLFDCVVRAMRELCRQSKRLADQGIEGTAVEPGLETTRINVSQMEPDGQLTPEMIAQFEMLWEDPGIKKTWELRSLFQLQDNADYLFHRMAEFIKSGYIPSFDDYLRIRVKSTGFHQEQFEVNVPGFKPNYIFQFTDVGGQRSERKKWMRVLDNVSAVLYFVAISEYDQTLYEDWATNRLHEAVKLFETVVEMGFFGDNNKTVVLFFNKIDLFDQKIEQVPFNAFPDEFQDDPHDRQQVIDFLARKFSQIWSKRHTKPMHVYVTCATDTNHIQKVFRDIQVDLVRSNLENCGLV